MNTNNRITLKNVWKKPLAGLLGLSILASMSTACFANQKDAPVANERQIDAIASQNTKHETIMVKTSLEMTEEEHLQQTKNQQFYDSLQAETKKHLNMFPVKWKGYGTLSPQEEENIKALDALFADASTRKILASLRHEPSTVDQAFEITKKYIKLMYPLEKNSILEFPKEDIEGRGWKIAEDMGRQLGLNNEFVLEYSPQDREIIRKVSSFFEGKENAQRMDLILAKNQKNEAMTIEESKLISQYENALLKLRKIPEKIKSSEESWKAYEEITEKARKIQKKQSDYDGPTK